MEKICNQLEELLSDMIFCGLKNISADMDKLKNISDSMNDMDMETGRELLIKLYDEILAFKRGENDGKQAVSLICTLECYIQNILQ